MKQLNLGKYHQVKHSFGGSLVNVKAKTNPKVARPLSSKLPIHLVLRSERSWMRLPKFFARVDETVAGVAKCHGVRVYQYANVGNHIHALIKIPARGRWAAFIRELTGRLGMLREGGAAWVGRPFTRLVNGWRRAYRSCFEYVRLNAWEAANNLGKEDSEAFRELQRIWSVGTFRFRAADWDVDYE